MRQVDCCPSLIEQRAVIFTLDLKIKKKNSGKNQYLSQEIFHKNLKFKFGRKTTRKVLRHQVKIKIIIIVRVLTPKSQKEKA